MRRKEQQQAQRKEVVNTMRRNKCEGENINNYDKESSNKHNEKKTTNS